MNKNVRDSYRGITELRRITNLEVIQRNTRVMISFIICALIRMAKSRWARLVKLVARMREIRNSCLFLVGKPEKNAGLGRPRCRWEGNIIVDLRKIGCEDVDWMHLAQDRDQWQVLVKTVMNIWVP
jgi:hypothetical protein